MLLPSAVHLSSGADLLGQLCAGEGAAMGFLWFGMGELCPAPQPGVEALKGFCLLRPLSVFYFNAGNYHHRIFDFMQLLFLANRRGKKTQHISVWIIFKDFEWPTPEIS